MCSIRSALFVLVASDVLRRQNPVPTRSRGCVVLCDVPSASVSMQAFQQLAAECVQLGGPMVFVDPGFRGGANRLYTQRFADPQQVKELAHREVFSFGDTFDRHNTAGATWKQVGLGAYVGLPVSANSTIMAEVVQQEGGMHPHMIIDTGCPGTYGHTHVIKEEIMYAEVAKLMDDDTKFVELDWNANLGDGAGNKKDVFLWRDVAAVRKMAQEQAENARWMGRRVENIGGHGSETIVTGRSTRDWWG